MEELHPELGPLDTDMEEDTEFWDEKDSREKRNTNSSLSNPLPPTTRHETGYHRTTRLCLEQIREAMLHHRWQEAAEFMACYLQILEDQTHRKDIKEVLWRLGTEILHHHPNSKMTDYNILYERMKNSGVKQYLLISLEHAFHLLLHGQIEEAKRQLQVAEGWRYGKESLAQLHQVRLIQAYRSLLDYIIWSDKRATYLNNNRKDLVLQQEMRIFSRHVYPNLREILRHPGVWDEFIRSYVDMLEFNNKHDEALEVLSSYAYDSNFPPNPNAHVYLYEYLKRYNTREKNLLKVLKTLSSLVPSHELMLEYSALLLQSSKLCYTRKALEIVLEMLDFACWRSDLRVWKRLEAVIQTLKSQDSEHWEEVLQENMDARKEWWPTLHFTSFQAKRDSEENPELMELKASLKVIICPGSSLKYSAAEVKS